jgi:peptide/nickel transport system ATP-binding protein
MSVAPLLDVRDLRTHFYRHDGVVKAVDGISYTLQQGEALGIVGESGCGKSVGVYSLLQLVKAPGKIVGGQALFEGRDLLKLGATEMQRVRGKEISVIFQDPMTSLNPTIPVGRQIAEVLLWHNACGKKEAASRAVELLTQVGIPSPAQRAAEFPFQFSGGMRQRVMIAMALAGSPQILIADEPTTALDVTIQAQILSLLKNLQQALGMGLIMITHDLGVAARVCDKIVVMYAGKVVETAPTEAFVTAPQHPYSIGLLRATPDIGRGRGRLVSIPGAPPSLIDPPAGCHFHPRCPFATDRCRTAEPALVPTGPGCAVACWEADAVAKEVASA